MLEPRILARRRVLLVGGVVLVGAGCDLDPRADSEPAPTVGSVATSGAPADPSEEADLELLDAARTRVLGMAALVSETRGAYPGLRRSLAPLHRMHREHGRLLDSVGPQPTGEAGAPIVGDDDAGAALSAVRRAELGHQRFLGRAAVQAASGPFARMLASMSAGVASHVTALPAAPELP